MANLEAIISNKTAADTQWKEQRQAERENAIAMQDASVTQITTQPEAYARYLDLQGDNPTYSAGNIALVMLQDPNATVFGTTDRWRTQGRSVMDTERNKSVKIFARLPGDPSSGKTPRRWRRPWPPSSTTPWPPWWRTRG